MHNNEFEKQVQEELANFSLVPDEAVWQKVEGRIKASKRKRRFIILWIMLGVMLAIAGLLYVGYDKAPVIAEVQTTNKAGEGDGLSKDELPANKGEAGTAAQPQDKPNGAATRKLEAEEQQNSKTEKSLLENNTAPDAKSSFANQGRINNRVSGAKVGVGKEVAQRPGLAFTENTSSASRTSAKGRLVVKQSAPNSTDVLSNRKSTTKAVTSGKPGEDPGKSSGEGEPNAVNPDVVEKDAANNLEPANAADKATRDTAAVAGQTKEKSVSADGAIDAPAKNEKAQHKKWRFGAELFAGISNNVEGMLSAKSEQSSRFVVASSQSPTAAPSTFNLAYTSSFSFGGGLLAEKQLGDKWSLQLGISYHYYSASSRVGNRINQPATFRDSALFKVATVPSFYSFGANNEASNKYHVLKVPVRIQYRLNNNSQQPLLLSLGLTPGYLFGSNALYVNYGHRVVYREREQFNRLQMFGELGVQFTPVRTQRFQLRVGPYASYGFSNLTKTVVNANQHLSFIGLKANIIFNRKK